MSTKPVTQSETVHKKKYTHIGQNGTKRQLGRKLR